MLLLTEQIKAACDSTEPRTTARMNALKSIRWVLRDQHGNYAGMDKMGVIIGNYIDNSPN